MSQNLKNIFAVSATDKALQSKSSGVFGLNTNGYLTNLSFEEGVGKNDNPYKSVAITYQIADKEYKNSFFLNDTIKVGNGDDRKDLNPGDEGYEEAFYNQYVQTIAVIKHSLGAVGVTEDTINRAMAGFDGTQLLEGVKTLISLLPANHKAIPLDIFLEYQWVLKEDQDMTYLGAPKNMKGSEFLCPSVLPVGGKWTEVIDAEGNLTYVDGGGNKHLFTRSKGFMDSHKAIQQFKDGRHLKEGGAAAGNANPAQAAKKTSWD